jgi:threonine dehydratase
MDNLGFKIVGDKQNAIKTYKQSKAIGKPNKKVAVSYFPKLNAIRSAAKTISIISEISPLTFGIRLSKEFDCTVELKREDLQGVRSYKIRGAYNKISSLSTSEIKNGVICASAGNHVQGFEFACHHLKIKGTVYMPPVTLKQKVAQIRLFGGDWVDVVLQGDTFDDAAQVGQIYGTKMKRFLRILLMMLKLLKVRPLLD